MTWLMRSFVENSELHCSTSIFGVRSYEEARRRAPLAGHALELVTAAVIELETRPDYKIAQRASHEHVVRPGQRAHARADVHGDSADNRRRGRRTRRCATPRAPRCR